MVEMSAEVKDVFFTIGGEEIKSLTTDKADAPVLDHYQFDLTRLIHAILEMSRDPSDGNYYTLIIGVFIDGVESGYCTDWFPNIQEKRTGDYPFNIPGYAKFSKPNVAHTVQIKLGVKKTAQWMRVREYNLCASPIFYYKVSPSGPRD